MPHILDIARRVLTPYVKNHNSGNAYEIWTSLVFLRRMGMTNKNFDELQEFFTEIEHADIKPSKNGNKGTLTAVERIKKIPVGKGLVFDGMKIVDMKNATQDDKEGTGDLILISDKNDTLKISVAEGAASKVTAVKKCLTNAAATRMGCTEEDIEEIKALEKGSSKEDKNAELVKKYGEDPSAWPKRPKTDVAKKPCMDTAKLYETRFNSLSVERRREIMNDVHWICTKPADYYAFVNKKTWKIRTFKIGDCPIKKDTWNPTIKINSVFIETYNESKMISKTQIKFNNGVGTSMRKWNLVADLNYLFDIKHLMDMDFKRASP
jgi:hypothetical protein